MTADGRVDVAGVLDATQIQQVYGQWGHNERSRWKLHLLGAVLGAGGFTGKRSTPYSPGSVHDEIEDAALADELAAFVDSVHALYPEAPLPG